ncbi:autotransporter outer membrane beta-barrel domain-containing protein [Yersinia enterocolitica]|uniref:autotransporter outer membrane beta-barrel domain-containing protein n=1 Tax=Yersinia enterocolitica TaxID=630 RepID=UPI000C9E86A8|nr:autotransporter outer membrane beta-barrel domain-containing protein [Yersinia enterocolitica]PNM20071.1 pertactin family virulence factor/autotransporter [Yersinia enterocolitica]
MENTNNPRRNILKPSTSKPTHSVLKKTVFKKSPIAKLVLFALFICGSSSAISDAKKIAPTHSGVVDKDVTLKLKQVAKDSIINGTGKLKLTGNSRAYSTQVNTGDMLPFQLEDQSIAIGNKISHGSIEVTDDAKALGTEIGLVNAKHEVRIINNITKKFEELVTMLIPPQGHVFDKKLGRMDISQQGKSNQTTIGMHGSLYLGGTGIAENTHIQEGGELVVQNLLDTPTLKDTTVSGVLTIMHGSDVLLQGKTEFSPTAKWNIKNNDIINEGQLIFRNGGVFYARIDGTGSLIKEDANTLTLQGNGDSNIPDYVYSGETYINNGDLLLSSAILIGSPVIGKKNTMLILANGSQLITTVQGGNVFIGNNSLWEMRGNSSINDLTISDTGVLNFNDKKVGDKLIIESNYVGQGGTLIFYSKLEGDDSETDRMLVEGNTYGHTKVIINNLGGEGAQTDVGILLIEVKGESKGEFEQDGRNVAGAYEYFLRRGSEDDRKKNWYMISDAAIFDKKSMAGEKIEEAIPESEENKTKVNPQLPELAENDDSDKLGDSSYKGSEGQENPPTKSIAATAPLNKAKAVNNSISQKIYRPENGSYIANLSMARNLFTSDLDNRSGNYKYKDAVTGEWRTSSMWIQTQGGIKQFGKTVDQLNIKGKYYSIQLGGDVAQWDIGTQGSGRIGMLAGMGKATNHSKSNITGYYSNGSVNGYNLGVYATWLTDQQNKTGLYIDTLAQYSWFNNAVNGQKLAEEKYKSSGFTSSIESGYTFNIGSTEQLSYFIQPNAKITWVGINAQTHTAANKDIINYTNRGQLITRIGAKTYLQTTNNSDQQFMPFIAVNWLHQNHNTGTQLSGKSVENSSKNSAEFKIGVESKIDQRLHAWANINHQIGNYNTNDTNALVGIKYAF